MRETAAELHSIIVDFNHKISQIPEDEFTAKPLPHKWSKKEVLGHLIDSAQNNLRRFICGQYETTPPKIVYDQDFWVAVNGYQAAEKESVLQHWVHLNNRIANVLMTMPAENHSRQCDTGKEAQQLRTLDWLAADYVKHLKHHLNQIIPGSYDIRYSSL
ncbi:MAG TPA: DinB family protein [Ohtaekwangia sp.]|nr:DinB family protein [Ohtaekwangia sp.]